MSEAILKRKSDIYEIIEKRTGELQRRRPDLSREAAMAKYLESDEGAALYKLYKQIQ